MSSSSTPHAIPVEQQESLRYTGYQRYKSSDVPWLGQIPERWDTTRLKWLFRVINGATPKTSKPEFWDGEVAWSTPEDLGASEEIYLNSTERTLTQEGLESCGAGLVPPGCVLLSTRAPIGYVRLAGQPTATNQGCRSLIPQKAVKEPQFYFFALQSARPMLQAFGTGATFQELSSTELGLVSLPVPPPEEQKEIASFLRRETRRIDRLIDKKERLIELLEERRTALITKAVTKGLDPNVPMKDSGMEWLGAIPEHWDLVSLTNLSPDITVGIVVKPTDHYEPEGVPCLRSQNIKLNEISRDNMVFISEAANQELEKSQIYAGDLVTVRTGDPGTTAVVPSNLDGANCVDLIIIRKPELADQQWLCWFMNSKAANVQYRIWSGGAAQQHLNVGAVKRVRVPVPPTDEQRAIAKHIDQHDRRFKKVKEKLVAAIKHLQEYRSALITAAVTGKIDVRDHAA